MDWCFVHAADTHLDTPMKGLQRVDPALHRRIVSASLDAFDDLVDLTIDRDARFLAIAGDVYDGAQRGVRAQARVAAAARRLDEAGVRLLMVHGNHDPVREGWAGIEAWPASTTVFEPGDPQAVRITTDDGHLLAVVVGVSFATRAEEDNLALRFTRTQADVPHVALLHANVGSNPDHDPYAPATVDDLASRRFDYWALGHIHTRQHVATPDTHGFWAHYPGNLQGRSPKPAERGPKGASLVRVVNGVVQQPQLVELDRVRFAEVTATIDDDTSLDGLLEQLGAAARASVAEASGRILVLRATVHGDGPLHEHLADPAQLEEVRESLNHDLPSDLDATFTSVKDRTGPPATPADVAPARSVLDDAEATAGEVEEEVRTELARLLGDDAPDVDELLAEARRTADSLLQRTRSS